jgi:hypothetical protein
VSETANFAVEDFSIFFTEIILSLSGAKGGYSKHVTHQRRIFAHFETCKTCRTKLLYVKVL